MVDSKGNGLVVGCYVRAHPREPRKPYKGWVVAAGAVDDFVIVENERGHREEIRADRVEVLKPSAKAKGAHDRMRVLCKAISDRANAGRRFGDRSE
jgi:hypothetical protein